MTGPGTAVTYARHLIPWTTVLAQIMASARAVRPPPAMPYSKSANDLVAVWKGDITRLSVPAIAFGSNPGLVLSRGASAAIYHSAGHRLVKECRRRRPARIAEALSTTGGDLPVQALIHLPLPDLYHEPTLVSAVMSALNLACVQRTPIVAFASLHGVFFDGDDDVMVHALARTIRIWADKAQDRRRLLLDRVVLTAPNADQYDLLLHWLQVYFPSLDPSRIE